MRVNTITALLMGTNSAFSLVHAADPMFEWKTLGRAIYFLHGGTLADRQVPTQQDRKLSIVIDGQAAKDNFDSIGPDMLETCSGDKGDRTRDKGGIQCTFTVTDKGTKDGPYRCWIGLDLRTGASVGLVSC